MFLNSDRDYLKNNRNNLQKIRCKRLFLNLNNHQNKLWIKMKRKNDYISIYNIL